MQQEPEDGQWAIMKVQAHDISRPDQIQLQLEKLVDIHSVVAQKLRADQAS
jgi:acetolactate synthase regulatory subunit